MNGINGILKFVALLSLYPYLNFGLNSESSSRVTSCIFSFPSRSSQSLLFSKAELTSQDMLTQKRVAVVTGSTDGIGLHTASRLLDDDPSIHLVIHGRCDHRLMTALHTLKSRHPEASVDALKFDLSSKRQAIAFADHIIQSYSSIDIFINNAGVFADKYALTEDGLELTFAVNVLSPFILLAKLFPLLQSTPRSRVINVSSMSQSGGKVDFSNLQYQHGGFSNHAAYSRSKLLMAAISHEMSLRCSPIDTLVVSCDPGTVNTKMLVAGWGHCGIDVEHANDEFELATCPFDSSRHGKYFDGLRQSKCERQVYDESFRFRLWSELEQLSGVSFPDVAVGSIDNQYRCHHYKSELDIVALRLKCCQPGKFHCCIECHNENADHAPVQWERSEFDELAIICGSCKGKLSIHQYLSCNSQCPICDAKFNPGCSRHYHHYFKF